MIAVQMDRTTGVLRFTDTEDDATVVLRPRAFRAFSRLSRLETVTTHYIVLAQFADGLRIVAADTLDSPQKMYRDGEDLVTIRDKVGTKDYASVLRAAWPDEVFDWGTA